MKYTLRSFILLIITLTCSSLHAGDPRSERFKSLVFGDGSMIYNKSDGPIKFFNGFAVGAGAGVGLFHGDLADYNIFAPMDNFREYYRFGWHVMAEREMVKGIRFRLQFEKGTLGGGRLPGLQSIPVTFESQYNSLSFVLSYDVLGQLFREQNLEKTKTYLLAEAGAGITWFRALQFWDNDDRRVRDFEGYTVVDYNPPTQRYIVEGKSAPAISLNFPVGFTFGYRVNYKTDLTFRYTLNNLLTDRLDTWDRDWTANDKYSYFGLGLVFNFNREGDQYPSKKSKNKAKEKQATAQTMDGAGAKGGARDNVSPRELNLENRRYSNRSRGGYPGNVSWELEEIRMKMFELQLRLFQMQYLPDTFPPKQQ